MALSKNRIKYIHSLEQKKNPGRLTRYFWQKDLNS